MNTSHIETLLDQIEEIDRGTAAAEAWQKSMREGTELQHIIENMYTVKNSLREFCVNTENMTIFDSQGELDAALGFKRLEITSLESMTESEIELLTRKYEGACESWIGDKIKQFIEWVKGIFRKIKEFFTGNKQSYTRQSDEATKAYKEAESAYNRCKDKNDLSRETAGLNYHGKTKAWYESAFRAMTEYQSFLNIATTAINQLVLGDAKAINTVRDLVGKTKNFQHYVAVDLNLVERSDVGIGIEATTNTDAFKDGSASGMTVAEAGFEDPLEVFVTSEKLLKQVRHFYDAAESLCDRQREFCVKSLERLHKDSELSDDKFVSAATNIRTAMHIINVVKSVSGRAYNVWLNTRCTQLVKAFVARCKAKQKGL